MDEDEISVISVREISLNEESEKDKDSVVDRRNGNDTSPFHMLHVFSVVAVCIVVISSVTVIPRTNSVFYQTHWMEINIPIGMVFLARAGNEVLDISIYFKEKSLQSFQMLLRMYFLFITMWIVPYLVAYLTWCIYLGYNWPIPYLYFNYIVSGVGFLAGIWLLLPHDVCSKKSSKEV